MNPKFLKSALTVMAMSSALLAMSQAHAEFRARIPLGSVCAHGGCASGGGTPQPPAQQVGWHSHYAQANWASSGAWASGNMSTVGSSGSSTTPDGPYMTNNGDGTASITPGFQVGYPEGSLVLNSQGGWVPGIAPTSMRVTLYSEGGSGSVGGDHYVSVTVDPNGAATYPYGVWTSNDFHLPGIYSVEIPLSPAATQEYRIEVTSPVYASMRVVDVEFYY